MNNLEGANALVEWLRHSISDRGRQKCFQIRRKTQLNLAGVHGTRDTREEGEREERGRGRGETLAYQIEQVGEGRGVSTKKRHDRKHPHAAERAPYQIENDFIRFES